MSRPVPGIPSVLYDERLADPALDLAEVRRSVFGLSVRDSLDVASEEKDDPGEDLILDVLRRAGY